MPRKPFTNENGQRFPNFSQSAWGSMIYINPPAGITQTQIYAALDKYKDLFKDYNVSGCMKGYSDTPTEVIIYKKGPFGL